VLLDEVDREVVLLIESGQALVRLLLLRLLLHAGGLAHRGAGGRGQLLAVDLDLGLARLQHHRGLLEKLGGEEDRVLDLDQGSEGAFVVFDKVFVSNLPYLGMHSRDRNIISDPDITRSIPADLEHRFLLRVEDEEGLRLGELLLLVA